MIFLVKCPHCGNNQQMITKDVLKAKRVCVYCGKLFRVHNNPNKSTIQ
jgi:uncharacterized Zn-finger protein